MCSLEPLTGALGKGVSMDHFWQYVAKSNPTECWQWKGGTTGRGYGSFWDGARYTGAHRIAYSFAKGPIPEGLQIDHLCRNKLCVNPAHLEAVTQKVNVLRGIGITAQNAKKTHCVNGHEFTKKNTMQWSGGRACKACHNLRTKLAKRIKRQG